MTTADRRDDFWAGLRVAVTAILASPSFIYVVDRGRPQPDAQRPAPLTSLELATRLSLFLWNTSPDELLLDAAERDELAEPDGAAPPRACACWPRPGPGRGCATSSTSSTAWTRWSSVRRDKDKLPATSVRAIGRTMKEETMLVLEHNIFTERVGLPEAVHRPGHVPEPGHGGAVRGPGGRRRHVHQDHAGRRQPAARPAGARLVPGRAPRRPTRPRPPSGANTSGRSCCASRCPRPPPDVDTNLPPAEGAHQTMRERLEEHRLDFGCAKCHRLIDPSAWRSSASTTSANTGSRRTGWRSIPAASWTASPSPSPVELGELLSRDPRVPACLMKNLYSYATGRIPEQSSQDDQRALAELSAAFAALGLQGVGRAGQPGHQRQLSIPALNALPRRQPCRRENS